MSEAITDMKVEDVIESFDFLDDWEERYRYIIDLGKRLPEMSESEKTRETKVEGCVSQVWLVAHDDPRQPGRVIFVADSDAHIVRGLVAILLIIYSGKTAEEILEIDARGLLGQLDLDGHLSPSRSNGLYSMVRRIRELAVSRASGGGTGAARAGA
ncbi:MAG: SufE family protein [Rhodovibrionaceae bacterium]